MAKIQEVLPADSGSDAEPLEKVQNVTNYNVFANDKQHSEQPRSINDTYVIEQDDNNAIPDSSNTCDNDDKADQNADECDDERVALANLIANFTLDTEENKKIELAKYKIFKDQTLENDNVERKLKETQEVLTQKENDIKEGLKLKAHEISIIKQKHDELLKHSLLTKSSFEGLVKEKNQVIKDLKLKEEKDIDKLIIPFDTSDLANRFTPDREETLTLEQESRSKLNKDLVKPYDYTKQNSLYEIFKPPSREYLDQLARANEIRKTMWRKSFTKSKPNIVKNISFLPISKSNSKSRQAYNVMSNNINHLKEIVDLAWHSYTFDKFRAPTTEDMTSLLKTCLMPLAIKTQNDSQTFVKELKQEMFKDLEYVKSLEKEDDKLESNKADFSNMYDLLL
ncbi:hypothetical protein Tco_0058184 [Tanacetum coccineum]